MLVSTFQVRSEPQTRVHSTQILIRASYYQNKLTSSWLTLRYGFNPNGPGLFCKNSKIRTKNIK